MALSVMADPETAVCKSRNSKCSFYDECLYQREKAAAKAADVILIAHDRLRLAPSEELSKNLAMIVIEEGFIGDLKDTSVTVETLLSDINRISNQPVFEGHSFSHQIIDKDATRELITLRRKFPRSFEGYLTRDMLVAAGLSSACCWHATGLEWRRKRDSDMTPGMLKRDRMASADRCHLNGQIPALVALWKCAAELLESDNEATGRVELVRNRTADGDCLTFKLSLRNSINDKVLEYPILYLDRTADVDIVKHYLTRLELLTTGTPITPHAKIIQIPSSKFSKTSLIDKPKLVDEIVDYVLAMSNGEPTLVVTHEAVERCFHGHKHIRTLHFGAVAGKDEYGDVRYEFVIDNRTPARKLR